MDHERYHFSNESYEDKEEQLRLHRKEHQEQLRRRKEQKKKQAIMMSIVSILVVAALSIFVAFAGTGLTEADQENTVVTKEMLKEDNGFTSFTLMAAGDNLLHTKLYTEAAARSKDGGYDFTYLYQDVAPLTKDADLCFINQETPLATAIAEPSSYPMFNTPSECITSLHDIGFNVFNIVSNHTLDQGAKGVQATIDFMKTVPDSLYVGAYENKTEMEKVHTIEINGVSVAFAGFTEMTNGLVLDSKSDISFVYTSDEEEMEKLIKNADKKADVVMVSVHWGQENITSALDAQKTLAQKFANWGADVVIGHHPHVLEEIETVTAEDGRQVPVCYSLGNFTSTMSDKANHVGGFFKCNVVYDKASGQVSIADEEFIPVINYFTEGKSNIHVIPFSDYTEELAAKNGAGITIDYVNDLLRSTVGADLVKGLDAADTTKEDSQEEE